ncbi:MAG: DUF1707 domain-containing protein [Nocardioidaceae bacterium]
MSYPSSPPSGGDPWSSFALDPRAPGHASLRASDADREVVHQLLATAYAEGRIDRAELDERTDGVARAKTLGELPGFVSDLVVTSGAPMLASRTDLAARARDKFAKERAEALWGLLSVSAITWTIWAVVTPGAFMWPIFVTLAATLNLMRVLTNKRSFIESEVRRLEKKERKALPPGSGS